MPGFGAGLLKKHAQHGLRVVLVEYLDGGRVLGQVAGNPLKAWRKTDSFLYRAHALQRGSHAIKARIKLVAADVPPGETSRTQLVESPVMKVEIATPDEHIGEIVGYLGAHRGKVLAMRRFRKGSQKINALAPLSEMFGFATPLRTMSSGRANFATPNIRST